MSSTEAEEPGKPWSMRQRLTRWIVGGVAAMFVLGTALVAWFIEASLRRELDALALEEIAELEVRVMQGPLDESQFAQLVRELDLEHPEARLSLCVWRMPYDEPWVTVGARPRIAWPPARPPAHDSTTRLDRLFRSRAAWITAQVRENGHSGPAERIRAALLIDGAPRAEELERAVMSLLGVALVAGAVVTLGGALFSRRMAGLLEEVAASAAAARLDATVEPRAPRQAPEEIRRVAEAFSESVQQMRAQHSRNVLLTAGLAHELRSPLQNLVSEAEVALMRAKDDSEHRGLLLRQLEELRALALVVDNLITLTALRGTELLPRRNAFDLADEIGIRLGYEESEAARRGVTIEVHQSGDCTVQGDREAIVLMLRNLVGNAIRWTPERTTVTLTLEGSDDELVITVEDQGPGVPSAQREAIFEAFYQGQSPDGMRAGYGLGLALARTAARAEGGEIEVRDAASGGAAFIVRLPRSKVGAGRREPVAQR